MIDVMFKKNLYKIQKDRNYFFIYLIWLLGQSYCRFCNKLQNYGTKETLCRPMELLQGLDFDAIWVPGCFEPIIWAVNAMWLMTKVAP